MPYEKLKTESYSNLGGINTKVSEYLTKSTEVLDMVNFNFNTPGAWSSRPGSTQCIANIATFIVMYNNGYTTISTGSSANVSYIQELFNFNGASCTIFAVAKWATMYSSSFTANVYSPFVDMYTAQYTSGVASITMFAGQSHVVKSFETLEAASYTKPFIFSSGDCGNWKVIQGIAADAYANIQVSKFNGNTLCYVGFPIPPTSVNAVESGSGGYTGALRYIVGYRNNDGAFSPVRRTLPNNPYSYNVFTSVFINASGKAQVSLSGFTTTDTQIAQYNLKEYAIFREDWNSNVVYQVGTLAITGVTFVDTGNPPPFVNANLLAPPGDYGLGIEIIKYAQRVTDHKGCNVYYNFFPYLRIYPGLDNTFANNSSVVFSDPGDPDSFSPQNRFDVGREDGDAIVRCLTFLDRMVIFKERSVHEMLGDLSNYTLPQRSKVYGLVNHDAVVQYDNLLAFLDEKGIVRYNGATFELISWKVLNTNFTLNIAAAKTCACAVHNKLAHEIWFAVPTGSNTSNDTIIVYDYLSDAWTTYKGLSPVCMAYVLADSVNRSVWIGKNTPHMSALRQGYYNDEGTGFTCQVKTRFTHEINESTTKQYRRLYLGTVPPSATYPIVVQSQVDHGTTFVNTATMMINSYQQRIDFGIPAKSIAHTITAYSATMPIVIHGYTNEYRLQRRV